MEKIKNLTSVIASAADIAVKAVNNEASAKRIEIEKNKLQDDIDNNPYIKVPFVGDFNAGKSSLLNSMMGNHLLPTDVIPTTAVSYELYYSENEKLVVNRGGTTEEEPISKIGSLTLSPGDIVKVYVNNEFIKSTNDRGIVLVDMPGIDSGIEAHNNAILNYIKEGTFFFLVTLAPQGTMRDTTIRFAEELKKYGLQMAVVISKTDQVEENSLANNVNEITTLAQRHIAPNVKVATCSAAKDDNAGVKAIIDGLDAEATLYDRFAADAKAFINNIISELQMQMPLLVSDRKSFEEKIQNIEKEKQLAITNIRSTNESAQPLESSADDILNDVREALMENSSHLANVIYNSRNNNNVISAELLNIIRPVLVTAFKRELTEYNVAIGNCVKDFTEAVANILNDENNKISKIVNDIYKDLKLDSVLKTALPTIIARILSRFSSLSKIIPILGPIIGTLVSTLLTSLIGRLFSGNIEEKIKHILQTELISKITESLRPQIIQMLEEQRQEAMAKMEETLENENAKYNDNIRAMQEQQLADEAAIKAKVQSLQTYVEQLQALLQQI